MNQIELPNSVTNITALDDGKLEITYANGTHSIVNGNQVQPAVVGTTIPSQAVSIGPEQLVRDSFNDTYNKIEDLTKRLSKLEDSVNKKYTAQDITVTTIQTYSRLLLAKLPEISTNKQTQEKVQTIIQLIERKMMGAVLNE